jgi:transketolase
MEKPTIEEPEVKVDENPQEQAQALLSELQALGLDDPEKLHNTVKAAQQVGNMGNKLGETRNENEELRQEIARLSSMMESQNRNEYGETPSIDLDSQIKRSINSWYSETVLKPQQQVQQQFFSELQAVAADPDYSLVAQQFEKHIQSPSTQAMIANGQTSVKQEFDKTIRASYRSLLGKTTKTLEQLAGKKANIPHVESSETSVSEVSTKDEEYKENLQKLVKGRSKGALSPDDALQGIVDQVLFGNQ